MSDRAGGKDPTGEDLELRTSYGLLMQELTDLKLQHKELLKLASFPELNPNPVLEVCTDGSVRYLNPAALKHFPDLREKGADHPFLLDLNFIVARFREDPAASSQTEVRVGDSWYERSSYFVPEEDCVRIYASDISQRKRVEDSMHILSEEQEVRIQERTKDLVRVAAKLSQEITERRISEERVGRLNRLYSVRSRVNEAIARIHDPDKLFRQLCRVIVEHGFFQMAWIGIADPASREVKPIAQWGDNGGYLGTVRIIAADVPEGKGPTGRAIYELRSVICSDIATDPMLLPWREKALSHGFRSSAAFPIRTGSVVVGALTVYADTAQFFSDEEVYLLESLAEDISHATDAIDSEKRRLQAEEELRNSRGQLRALSAHLQQAREEERIRIGREIHDGLGQILTAAGIGLGRASKDCSPDSPVFHKIREVSDLIDIAIDDIQGICSDLRPRVLDHLGLAAALRWETEGFSERVGIQCRLELPENEVMLPDDVTTALFRIFQEALTNVDRHSGADSVSVSLTVDGDVSLEIRDNGRGITAPEIARIESYGIIGMKERARLLGGTVDIRGMADNGTIVSVTIPLNSQEANDA